MRPTLKYPLFIFSIVTASARAGAASPGDPYTQSGTPPIDGALENLRRVSARNSNDPVITSVESTSGVVWLGGGSAPAPLRAGDKVILHGSGFGAGVDVDFAKILVGRGRAIERDLPLFEGTLDIIGRDYYETPVAVDAWPSDIAGWSDTRIEFTVPPNASSGNLIVQIQKRISSNASLVDAGNSHSVWDSLTERVTRTKFFHGSDAVSVLGEAAVSNAVPVTVDNPGLGDLVAEGEKIYWSYDFNIGMTHHLSNLDWNAIIEGRATDPVTGKTADPRTLFGAIPVTAGEAPAVASTTVSFAAWPIATPVKSLWGFPEPPKSGSTRPTGYVGYVYAPALNPITNQPEEHIGFSCASCHASLVEYDSAPGVHVKKIVPGIPNPGWSMRWNVLGSMTGVKGFESGWDGVTRYVDKTRLIYATPWGTGEHSLVRPQSDVQRYHNDNLFSPIAIPVITRVTPLRRALSRTEIIAGFEGSYIHSEEPDGAVGAMSSQALKSLSAYMTTLDRDDVPLERVGLYRTLVRKRMTSLIDGASEGAFVQNGEAGYPKLASHLSRGRRTYAKSCLSCHASNFGTNTDENMIPLTRVGTYFSPTIYNKETQSVRTALIRNLYWVAQRGLLHDGHVKSVEDLVHPDRVDPSSSLYKKYYSLNPSTFRVAKGDAGQEQATRNQIYFVDVPWDKNNLYWDYQKMRREFGPRELGSKALVSLPAAPHPWPVDRADEVDDLVLYLMTL